MNDQQANTYMVELLYEAKPRIDGDVLLGELQKRCSNVDRLGSKEDLYLYAFPDLAIDVKGRRVPVQVFLAYPDKDKRSDGVDEALQQSWNWPGAKEVVDNCHASLLLTDMMARWLEPKTKLDLFQKALDSVLAVAPCKAIHWVPSQQVINPLAYLQARQSDGYHPLQFALNVRFYNISGNNRNEMLMDTIGLGTLGLPDLQCHFFDLDPNQVAHVLYNSAHYIFDNGDVIDDGNTIQGIKPNDKWRCQHEMALVKPEREVLDLDPGFPYAAGKRH